MTGKPNLNRPAFDAAEKLLTKQGYFVMNPHCICERYGSQKELAEQLFVSESAVSKWEMGKSYPDITLIPDICKALDVSEHELIEGANDTQYRQMKKEGHINERHKIGVTFSSKT